MSEKTVKCPICGDPYVVFMHYAGDQSACSKCRYRARRTSGSGFRYVRPLGTTGITPGTR